MATTVSKSKFKPQALEYFRRVQESGESLVITEHGRPVLRIAPYDIPQSSAAERTRQILLQLRGSVTHYDRPLDPADSGDWDALK